MARLSILFLFVLGFGFSESKPANLRVSTWVREDLFAGFMTADMERFAAGMKKVDAILATDPKAADAVAWRGGGRLFLAVRAHEAGEAAKFESLYGQAVEDFGRARELAGVHPGLTAAVHAISGGSYTVFSDRLPERLRKEGWQRSMEHYLALREVQKEVFDTLPVHMRGEVLAGLAQGTQRVHGFEAAKPRLEEVIAALPDSPYAARARRWLEKPEVAAGSSLTCQTCHEPGRLAAMRKREQ